MIDQQGVPKEKTKYCVLMTTWFGMELIEIGLCIHHFRFFSIKTQNSKIRFFTVFTC